MDPRLTAVAGLAVGIAAGAAGMYSYLNARFNERLQNEVDGVRTYYKARFKEVAESAPKAERPKEDKKDIPEEYQALAEKYNGDEPTTLTETGAITYDGKPLVTNESYDELFEVEDDERLNDGIYIITPKLWSEGRPGQKQVELFYYEEDGVVTDDQDIPVQDYFKFIGDDFDEKFGSNGAHKDEIYIRNMREAFDFHVTRRSNSYEEEMAGAASSSEGMRIYEEE